MAAKYWKEVSCDFCIVYTDRVQLKTTYVGIDCTPLPRKWKMLNGQYWCGACDPRKS